MFKRMIDVRDVISKSKLAYKYEQNILDSKIKELQENVTKDNFDFSLNKYRIFDGRLITQYNELSTESIILLHLKYQLRRAFNIQFPNRNKMIDELFNQIRICSSLSDFTIVKFDLKKYFYSISTEYIYDSYIKNSSMIREDKDLLHNLCQNNKYCVAGVPVFNYFVELASQDLDLKIQSLMSKFGLVFYKRYVDDGIIIFNQCISKKRVRQLLNTSIEAIFNNKQSFNKVGINENKFKVINRRYLNEDRAYFSFLGYEFYIDENYRIEIGITNNKRQKYQEKINKLIRNLYRPGDREAEARTRHLIKAHCSRVVYFAPSTKHGGVWVSKGIIANYNKFADYPVKAIHCDTKKFFKDIYFNAFKNCKQKPPHYLKNKRYSLYEGITSNRALIFNEMIGVSRAALNKYLEQTGGVSSLSKDYNYLLKDYLIHIKIGY